MQTRRKANHEGCYCPITSTAGELFTCSESCEWYVTENNDDYSGCAVPKILATLTSAYFKLEDIDARMMRRKAK